ncbi:MAG: N-methyl-D-aspartate receptor NMDAR2C subunit [Chromatiales bacterium]|nr:N-methyl-D-aspartate receptor NMDAR2C subunit [Chromatiales bacterium]
MDNFETLAKHPAEIAVALWFHDSVYATRRADNEALSAQWAERFMVKNGAELDCVRRVYNMILATKAHVTDGADAALMVDIDLSIPGTSADVFEQYDKAIRREYEWVPIEQYRVGRASVLRGFLERPIIFHTPLLRDQWEVIARTNLRAKIAELELSELNP